MALETGRCGLHTAVRFERSLPLKSIGLPEYNGLQLA